MQFNNLEKEGKKRQPEKSRQQSNYNKKTLTHTYSTKAFRNGQLSNEEINQKEERVRFGNKEPSRH